MTMELFLSLRQMSQTGLAHCSSSYFTKSKTSKCWLTAKYICKICHRTTNFFYLHRCEGNFSVCNDAVCSQQTPVYCVLNHSTLSFCRPVCVAGLMRRYWRVSAARFPPVTLTTSGWFPSLRHFLSFALGSWIKQHCVQHFFTHTLIYCWLYWLDSPWLSLYPMAVNSSYHCQVWLRLALLFCSFTPAQSILQFLGLLLNLLLHPSLFPGWERPAPGPALHPHQFLRWGQL